VNGDGNGNSEKRWPLAWVLIGVVLVYVLLAWGCCELLRREVRSMVKEECLR